LFYEALPVVRGRKAFADLSYWDGKGDGNFWKKTDSCSTKLTTIITQMCRNLRFLENRHRACTNQLLCSYDIKLICKYRTNLMPL